jgi:hypothetical protein
MRKGISMQRVLITCPSQGRPVSTVQRMRQAAFETMAGRVSFRCSACGEVHHWRKEDAWLEAAPAQLPQGAA